MTGQQPSADTDFASPVQIPTLPEPAPAGWYPDPERAGYHRFWDGRSWGDHRVMDSPVQDHGRQTASRPRVGAIIAASLAGTAVLLALIAGAVNAIVPAVIDATSGRLDTPVLTATAPATWERTRTIGGAATIAYDPAWEDISEWMGAEAVEETAREETGLAVAVDGAWVIEGDLTDGAVVLVSNSVADAGGPSVARVEAHAFVQNSTAGIDGVEVTSARAFRTQAGLSGYILEYEFPYLGEQLTDAVGVIVDGQRQLLVYTNGSERLGSGIDQLEIVLNSLTFE